MPDRTPLHRRAPAWDRIAAVTGRDPIQLRQILETIECAEYGTPDPPGFQLRQSPQNLLDGLPPEALPQRRDGLGEDPLPRRRRDAPTRSRASVFSWDSGGTPLVEL
ncbi:hypothetical protein [Kitasatospora sp. HPMI-4]|uniref:hypothetical protein n=1 Tax=Kitasatospora sp. HPMI-4 TaxID=3448443 RepID=UPI003F19A6E0